MGDYYRFKEPATRGYTRQSPSRDKSSLQKRRLHEPKTIAASAAGWLAFLVPDDWTPEQALAVFELIDVSSPVNTDAYGDSTQRHSARAALAGKTATPANYDDSALTALSAHGGPLMPPALCHLARFCSRINCHGAARFCVSCAKRGANKD